MRGLFIAAGLALIGCGAETVTDGEGGRVRGQSEVGGQIVSTVDGHPITLRDVEHAARLAGVSPRVALRRLQDELILAEAAGRAGLEHDPEVARAVRRAEVQVVLARAIEGPIDGAELDEAELAAAFEADLARFERPERRRSVHVLAQLTEDAPPQADAEARAWVSSVRDDLAAAADARATAFALQRQAPDEHPFLLVVEEVDPMPRAAEADPAYVRALYALDEPGVAPAPVRTAFGWHAIVLTEIEPAYEATREEALGTLRDERVAAMRAEALQALIGRLAEERGVELDTSVVGSYLARPDLLGGDE